MHNLEEPTRATAPRFGQAPPSFPPLHHRTPPKESPSHIRTSQRAEERLEVERGHPGSGILYRGRPAPQSPSPAESSHVHTSNSSACSPLSPSEPLPPEKPKSPPMSAPQRMQHACHYAPHSPLPPKKPPPMSAPRRTWPACHPATDSPHPGNKAPPTHVRTSKNEACLPSSPSETMPHTLRNMALRLRHAFAAADSFATAASRCAGVTSRAPARRGAKRSAWQRGVGGAQGEPLGWGAEAKGQAPGAGG
eukprot:363560-Chlamydomonas_euryale.AAC.7